MRRNIFKWNAVAIFLLVVFLQTACAEEKKYPTYPDVWGVELPVSKNHPDPIHAIIKMPDGDYMITYLKEWIYLRDEKAKDFDVNKDVFSKYASYSFFTSKETEFSSNEFNEFMKKMWREKRVISFAPPPPIAFVDGSRIESFSSALPVCEGILERELQKKDKNKKIIARKRLLYIFDEPIKKELCWGEGWEDRGKSYRQSISWPDGYRLIPLEDETFLIIGFMRYKETPTVFIMRFDKDFKTRSDVLNKNIFLVDASLYEHMLPLDLETIDKAFHEYLTNLNKGEDRK